MIGPDGEKHVHSFHDGDASIANPLDLVLKALGEQGAREGREVVEKLQQAVAKETPAKPAEAPTDALEAVSRKLDRILERLDSLEREIGQLKEAGG